MLDSIAALSRSSTSRGHMSGQQKIFRSQKLLKLKFLSFRFKRRLHGQVDYVVGLSVVSNLMFPLFKMYVGVGTDCREKELHNKGVKVIKHQAGLNERIFTGFITKL